MNTAPKLALILFLSLGIILGGVVHPRTPALAQNIPDRPEGNFNSGIFQQENRTDLQKNLPDIHIEPHYPTAMGGPDFYGYTWDDSIAMDWKEIISGTGVVPGTQIFPFLENPDGVVDDKVVGPIYLGFNFKFYENDYSQIFISSNGLIGFESGFAGDLAGASNYHIPFDYRIPENFLAPFWDDLIIGGINNNGKVAYGTGADSRGAYFVVQWYRVTKTDFGGEITFEAVLYEFGDIIFQYKELAGDLQSASIGIEDSTGVDGLAYLVNAPGLSANQAILLRRPNQDVRVKLYSFTKGGFNIKGQSVHKVFVRNTGDFGVDTFDLSYFSSLPGCQVILANEQGQILTDTDMDGMVDTGPLLMDQTIVITAKVLTPPETLANSVSKIQLRASSSLNILRSHVVELTSVVPSPFALTYRRGLSVYSELISPYQQLQALQFQYYAGGTFGLTQVLNNQFLGVSLVSGGTLYTNLEYMMVNSFGQTLFKNPILLTENTGSVDVRDNSPVLAVAPNGNIGIAWIRRLTQLSYPYRTNINVYYAVLNPTGNVLIRPEVNLTQNTAWVSTEDADMMEMERLRIEAAADFSSGNGRFHLAWIEKHTLSTGLITTDVVHAVINDQGTIIKPAALLTPANTDRIDYFEPALTGYYQNQVLLFYFVKDTNDPDMVDENLVYTRLDSNGFVIHPETNLYQMIGEGIDAVQLSDGSVGLAWMNSNTDKISAVVLGGDLSKPDHVLEFNTPDGRPSQAVSISKGMDGQAVITWMDGGLLERFYYTVLSSSGNVLVEPISFKYREGEPALETVSGLGNAVYIPQLPVFLPIMNK